MFGLMKSSRSVESQEQFRKHRFQYCGTCKTIGSIYGNKMRSALNSDAVFLGELLNSLCDNGENKEYPSAFDSINCLSLPKQEEIPAAFQYAATVNVLLTEVKVDDNIEDSFPFLWMWLKKLLSKGFKRAANKLKVWKFPINDIWNWACEQKKRERVLIESQFNKPAEPLKFLDHLSEPTAQMTAIAFAHGAKFMNKSGIVDQLFKMGYELGKIVYILDAYEDFSKDVKRARFNALRTAYNITDKMLPQHIREDVLQQLDKFRENVSTIIHTLPISSSASHTFSRRLESNLMSRTLRQVRVFEQACNTMAVKLTLKQKWDWARERTQQILERRAKHSEIGYTRLNVVYLNAYYILLAVLAPQIAFAQESESGSSDSAYGLCFALITFGCIYKYCCTRRETRIPTYTRDVCICK